MFCGGHHCGKHCAWSRKQHANNRSGNTLQPRLTSIYVSRVGQELHPTLRSGSSSPRVHAANNALKRGVIMVHASQPRGSYD